MENNRLYIILLNYINIILLNENVISIPRILYLVGIRDSGRSKKELFSRIKFLKWCAISRTCRASNCTSDLRTWNNTLVDPSF